MFLNIIWVRLLNRTPLSYMMFYQYYFVVLVSDERLLYECHSSEYHCAKCVASKCLSDYCCSVECVSTKCLAIKQ
jgi:hypothetical protein